MDIIISKQTFDTLVNYLVSKPYAEVIQIINMISDDIKQNTQNDKNETE